MSDSLMQYLLNAPSGAQQLMSILPLIQQKMGNAPGSVDPNTSGTSGNSSGSVNYPDGDTSYKYRSYSQPYSGVPQGMVTRFGVTLQPGPMHSLLDIARASGLLPGAQEVGQIDEGYRSYAAQAAAGGTPSNPGGNNPNATTAGNSYHGQGLAIDAGWWTDHAKLARALAAAGWNQFSPTGEPWHWSYGVTG